MIDSKKMLEDFLKFAPNNIVEPMVYALNLQGLGYDSKKGKIVSTEPIIEQHSDDKLTEFKEELSDAIFLKTKTEELCVERVVEIAHDIADRVLKAARKQIIKDIDKNAMVDKFIEQYGKYDWDPITAYEQGIIDTLKVIKSRIV